MLAVMRPPPTRAASTFSAGILMESGAASSTFGAMTLC
jgi:hypothetical protein